MHDGAVEPGPRGMDFDAITADIGGLDEDFVGWLTEGEGVGESGGGGAGGEVGGQARGGGGGGGGAKENAGLGGERDGGGGNENGADGGGGGGQGDTQDEGSINDDLFNQARSGGARARRRGRRSFS